MATRAEVSTADTNAKQAHQPEGPLVRHPRTFPRASNFSQLQPIPDSGDRSRPRALVVLGGAGGGVASQINVRYRYVNKGHRSHQTSAAGGRFDTLLFKGVGVVVVVVVFCLRRARALARQR
jgi:hypothetical protein